MQDDANPECENCHGEGEVYAHFVNHKHRYVVFEWLYCNKCFSDSFNCGEQIDDELDTYAVLVGMSGRINFCESCGKTYNIPNWYNRKED